jgi:hypothetical protein
MEQTERIKEMEQRMNRASVAVMELSAALDKLEAVKDDVEKLNEYYGSSEWKRITMTTAPDGCPRVSDAAYCRRTASGTCCQTIAN